jgi:D-alanine-D-alanine ligase-like ATP-grasp enzyme
MPLILTKLDVVVAGISLRRAPEGRWFCCEVNPSPGFTVYQQATGRRIAEAISDLLAGRRRSMRFDRLA